MARIPLNAGQMSANELIEIAVDLRDLLNMSTRPGVTGDQLLAEIKLLAEKYKG